MTFALAADLICDTEPQAAPNFDCSDHNSCGVRDPVENFMGYGSDACHTTFTQEQVRWAARWCVRVRVCVCVCALVVDAVSACACAACVLRERWARRSFPAPRDLLDSRRRRVACAAASRLTAERSTAPLQRRLRRPRRPLRPEAGKAHRRRSSLFRCRVSAGSACRAREICDVPLLRRYTTISPPLHRRCTNVAPTLCT